MTTHEPHITDTLARRLRTDPMEAVEHIAGKIGARLPASVAEAKTAAYLDARLRRAGMQVWLEPFAIPSSPGWDGWLLAVLAAVSAVLYGWFPLPSILLAFWGLVMIGILARRGGGPFVVKRSTTQHVIATHSVRVRPVKRVVVLAPLDAPPVVPHALQKLTDAAVRPVVRGGLYGLLLLLGLVGQGWAQIVPVAGLLLLAGLELWVSRQPGSPGAVSHAGALGALLASAETLAGLEHVELWVVGVGASQVSSGVEHLVKRYPFERDMTLFLGLEGIGRGALSYLAAEGWPRPRRAPPQALELARVAAQSQSINVTPRMFPGNTMTASLRAAGYQTLTITCLGPNNHVPLAGTADDLPTTVDAQLLGQTTRMIVGIVRALEGRDHATV